MERAALSCQAAQTPDLPFEQNQRPLFVVRKHRAGKGPRIFILRSRRSDCCRGIRSLRCLRRLCEQIPLREEIGHAGRIRIAPRSPLSQRTAGDRNGGSAAEKRCGRSRYFRSRCNGCRLRWRHGLRSRDPILPPGGRRHGLRLRDMERTEILCISFGVETGCESICEDSAQPLGDPFRASVVVQDESGLSIETFFMRKRRMDRVLEIPVVVVQVNSVADLGRTDEALLVGGKLPLFAPFLKDDEIAGHFRAGILRKEVVRQPHGRNQPRMLHQIAADGFVAGSVHDARRGDERQNAAFAERIQTLDEEIVVNGLERLSSNRVVALPKGSVENPGITEGNIGRHHVEITVIGRFDGLETVDDDLLSFPGQCREHLSGQQVFLEREDFDFAVGGFPERRRENPGPGAGVEQPAGNDSCIPERLGECTHDGRRCVECRQRRIAHALHEVFIPLFAAGIMAQQFVQFPHLWKEFPVGLSLREVVVRSGRLQDAFQRSEAAVRSQGISLLRGKYRRWSESDTQGGDVRLQMFPFIVCHAVRCGFG